MHKDLLKKTSICLLAVLFGAASAPAHAFDLFGWLKPKQETAENSVVNVADPVFYSVELKSDNGAINEVLRQNSVLIKEIATPASGAVGLVTRARIDQKNLLGALYSEGYYGGTISINIDGRDIDSISLDRDLTGTRPAVSINVKTGPQFLFAQPLIRSPAGDVDLSDVGIVAGEVAKSSKIIEAEKALVNEWRSKGYAFAKVTNRVIEADHNTNRLEVAFSFDPGVMARFGAINVVGNADVKSDFIVEQADILVGRTFDPERLQRATKRLQAVGVFDSVVVTAADAPSADGTVAVTIEVSERKPRTIGVGATAGNHEGLGIEGFWTHRNLFGGAESLRAEASIGRIGQGNINNMDLHAALIFAKPNAFGPSTRFEARVAGDVVNTNAFTKKSGKAEASLSNDLTEDLTIKGGLAAEYAVVDNGTSVTNTAALSAPVSLTYDTRDNTLDPTTGWYATLLAEPTYVLPSHTTFVKTSLSASTYYALDTEQRLVFAARGAAGTIFGTDIANVPTDRRFFAGGSGSIRGYGFQMAGPLSPSGKPLGGMSFAEASLEARYKVTNDIGVVAFVDAGGAFTSSIPGQGGSFYTGYGAGIRYHTPFGPIRADIAFPLNSSPGQPQYGLYLGVGQAF